MNFTAFNFKLFEITYACIFKTKNAKKRWGMWKVDLFGCLFCFCFFSVLMFHIIRKKLRGKIVLGVSYLNSYLHEHTAWTLQFKWIDSITRLGMGCKWKVWHWLDPSGNRSDSHIYFNKRSFFFSDLCRFFDSQLFCVFSTPQGELDYQLQDQDNVVFISTLHGG